MSKKKIGGCSKKIRPHKVSKGQRRNVAYKTGNAHLVLLNAHRYQ